MREQFRESLILASPKKDFTELFPGHKVKSHSKGISFTKINYNKYRHA